MTDILDLYKAHYEFYHGCFSDDRSKYEWAAGEIFELITYDAGLDELFVKGILEVCKAILDGTTYEYIRDGSKYAQYILVCQLLYKFNWIVWGTSIRGAFFEDRYVQLFESDADIKCKDIVGEDSWTQFGQSGTWEQHTVEKIPFSVENIRALLKFMEAD